MDYKELLDATLQYYSYLRGEDGEAFEPPAADAENGPHWTDCIPPPTPRDLWKEAYGAMRMLAQGHHPGMPHPNDPCYPTPF